MIIVVQQRRHRYVHLLIVYLCYYTNDAPFLSEQRKLRLDMRDVQYSHVRAASNKDCYLWRSARLASAIQRFVPSWASFDLFLMTLIVPVFVVGGL